MPGMSRQWPTCALLRADEASRHAAQLAEQLSCKRQAQEALTWPVAVSGDNFGTYSATRAEDETVMT
jgi:hypothetical protein